MENIQKKLDNLKSERASLTHLYNVSFATEAEIVEFIKSNQKDLKRLKELEKEIRELEWQLMSPQEKLEYLEEQKKLKDKFSDD